MHDRCVTLSQDTPLSMCVLRMPAGCLKKHSHATQDTVDTPQQPQVVASRTDTPASLSDTCPLHRQTALLRLHPTTDSNWCGIGNRSHRCSVLDQVQGPYECLRVTCTEGLQVSLHAAIWVLQNCIL